MFSRLLFISCCLAFSPLLQAQLEMRLDSISQVIQHSYSFTEEGEQLLSILRESVYNEAQIMTRQDRWHYTYPNGEKTAKLHYHYSYNPKSYMGEFYNEYLAYEGGPKQAKKKKTTFKSHAHSATERERVQQFDAEGKLSRASENRYDKSGELVYSKSTDYSYSPPMIHIDEVERNAAGQIIKWTATDKSELGTEKVREMSCKYLFDSLLLESTGYVYSDWNQTVNKYNKKTGEIKKSTISYGLRQSNGKVTIRHKKVSTYKNNRPIKSVEYNYKKKFKTSTFSYNGPVMTEKVDYKDKKEKDIIKTEKKVYNATGKLQLYERAIDGEPQYREQYSYDAADRLLKYTETEFRENGAHSITIIEYNIDQNPVKKQLFQGDKLLKLDEYSYLYQEN
ncbi:hypothetical protein PPO43_10215 [Saprospira sp. CCB-QB6]|uniref:hypothetical protein n=1 Tax=Saprospira sp. CCB-QB6 TaxID=3023936 RepID=UPI0023494786|nr:hypothetical protein [Saprospira sp. CCB-QB6]WCL80349.1 hypothetical protein PPO43_10215 [Saprospira sp. CCB-QB6]